MRLQAGVHPWVRRARDGEHCIMSEIISIISIAISVSVIVVNLIQLRRINKAIRWYTEKLNAGD